MHRTRGTNNNRLRLRNAVAHMRLYRHIRVNQMFREIIIAMPARDGL